jgi:hypothetical protein
MDHTGVYVSRAMIGLLWSVLWKAVASEGRVERRDCLQHIRDMLHIK